MRQTCQRCRMAAPRLVDLSGRFGVRRWARLPGFGRYAISIASMTKLLTSWPLCSSNGTSKLYDQRQELTDVGYPRSDGSMRRGPNCAPRESPSRRHWGRTHLAYYSFGTRLSFVRQASRSDPALPYAADSTGRQVVLCGSLDAGRPARDVTGEVWIAISAITSWSAREEQHRFSLTEKQRGRQPSLHLRRGWSLAPQPLVIRTDPK